MSQPKGLVPQHHLSAREIVQQHKEKTYHPWHSESLDMDFLVRPRNGAELAQLSDEATRLTADIAEYAGTADAPGSIEQLRLGLRATVAVLLDPATKLPRFGLDEIDDLLEFDMPTINELMEAANRYSGFTPAQAAEQEKNSVAMADASSSSPSPGGAATSTSSLTPAR